MSPVRTLVLLISINLVVIAAAIYRGISKADKPGLYFGEGRFTTLASCLQLLALAGLSYAIFRVRQRQSPVRGWWAPHILWLLMAAGFVFLAADDAFQIHENADRVIHTFLGITPTRLTDRLDDALVGSYVLAGLATLWVFRAELKSFRGMIMPLGCGFVCAFISVINDMLAGHKQVFRTLGANRELGAQLVQWADVGDGAFTLLAEGCFVAAFLVGWMQAQSGAASATVAAGNFVPARADLSPK